MMTRILVPIAMLVFLALPSTGLGQNCPCTPTDTHPCCMTAGVACTILSSQPTITNAGLVTSTIYGPVTCHNCPQPACCLGSTSNLTNRPCNIGVGITIEYSATATINSELSVGAKGMVEVSLGAALGVTIGTSTTLEVDCPVIAVPCSIPQGTVTVNRTSGRTAVVDHQWRTTGTWASRTAMPFTDCLSGVCPIAGNPFVAECPTTSSVGVANFGDFVCDPLVYLECIMLR